MTMAHEHLIMTYCAAVIIHLAYVGWVGLRYRALRKIEREIPTYHY